jgi:copper oxidase (laccase) domain-containing protein
MADLGARPDRVLAGIGPAVDPAAYQVGPDVAAAVRSTLGSLPGTFLRPDRRPGTVDRWLFDLPAANHHVLVEAGVSPGAVHRAAVTTGGAGPFFSDRAVRPCGRFALLARLAP